MKNLGLDSAHRYAYLGLMPKRSSKRKSKHRTKAEDENQAAFRVVAEATSKEPKRDAAEDELRNVMALMGRRGGLKGGRTRALRMSPAERSESASRAARARWSKVKLNYYQH